MQLDTYELWGNALAGVLHLSELIENGAAVRLVKGTKSWYALGVVVMLAQHEVVWRTRQDATAVVDRGIGIS